MTGRNHRFRQEEESRSQKPASTLSASWPRSCLTELGDLGSVLRAAESAKLVEPSLEGWVQFGERLMNRILESSRRRLSVGQRRQALFDRLTASDSRLKENKWVAFVILLLAGFLALIYLLV